MTATNHMLSGALIATVVRQPLLAVPLAFLSHFILDALPHYGNKTLRQPHWILVSDAIAAVVVLILLGVFSVQQRFLQLGCALVAASPDLLWVPSLWAELKGRLKPLNKVEHFLNKIQWGERTWGFLVEIPFGIFLAVTVFTPRLT